MSLVDGVQDLERLLEGVGGVGDVLADGTLVDQALLLLGQLLGAGLDGLVQLEDLGGEVDGALADLLQLADGVQELLVLGQADVLNLRLALLGVVGKALDEGVGAVADARVLEDRNQLVEEVGVGRGQDDLEAAAIVSSSRRLPLLKPALRIPTWPTAEP